MILQELQKVSKELRNEIALIDENEKVTYQELFDYSKKNYITNSYHVCVREEIDAFNSSKLFSLSTLAKSLNIFNF